MSFFLVFVWTLGLIALLYLVHMQIVFLNPPYVVQSGIHYYNKPVPGPVDGTLAEVSSLTWFVYATDLLLTIPAITVPMLFIVDLLCSPAISITGSAVLFAIFALLEAAKSVYFSLIWLGWLGLSCETEPLCVSRDPAGAASTPDSTFVLEAIFTYVFTVLSIALAIVLPAIFRAGRQSREGFMFNSSAYSRVGDGLDDAAGVNAYASDAFDCKDSEMIIGGSSAGVETRQRVKKSKSPATVSASATSSARETRSIF